jgi:hypothetical protein
MLGLGKEKGLLVQWNTNTLKNEFGSDSENTLILYYFFRTRVIIKTEILLARRSSKILCLDMASQEQAPNEKQISISLWFSASPSRARIPLLRAYSPGPKPVWLLIHLAPSPARARRVVVLFPFPVAGCATHPRSLRRSPAWQPPASLHVAAHPSAPFPNVRSSSCRAVPFRHRWPRHAPSLSASLTCVAVTYVAHFLVIRPLPIIVGAPLTLPWSLGHTCHGASGLPRPSQGHPRAWPVLVVLARRALPAAPTPIAGID